MTNEMHILEATWTRTLKIWGVYSLSSALIGNFLSRLVMEPVLKALLFDHSTNPQALFDMEIFAGGMSSVLAGIGVLRIMLSQRFSDFRIVLLSTKSQAATEAKQNPLV